MRFDILISIPVVAIVATSCALADGGPVLRNHVLRLGFAPPTDGCTVQGIRDAETDTSFVAPGVSGPLWRIELRSPEGVFTEVNSLFEAETDAALDEGRSLRIQWQGLAAGGEPNVLGVRATIRFDDADKRLSHWRLDVDNRSKTWGIWKVHFPLIQGLASDAGAYFTWPRFVGCFTPRPLERLPIQMMYPTYLATMQFAVVGTSKGCLYLATHDPRAFWKEYGLESDGKGAAQFRFTHFPEGMGEPGRAFRQPYEVTVGVLEGDWMDACKLYRQWALRQKWCGPPLTRGESTPQWYKDVAAWLSGAYPDEGTARAAQAVDEPMAYQWYSWHQIPPDQQCPDYFPAKPQFHRLRDMLRDADLRIVPYINARLWDTATQSFRDEGAEAWATTDEKGERYIEHWGNVNHAVMCPYTRFWQEKIAGICERIVGEFGCDGVYLDQVGSYLPVACFRPEHGHPLGGGDWWVRGYRDLVKLAQQRARAVRPDAILTTEDNAEPYMDLFDGLLGCNNTYVAADLAPMFHYVYSGHIITYGRSEGYDDLARGQQNAQMFVWGTQLCWMNSANFQPDMSTAKFLRALAKAYSGAARKFTLYGEMLRPARVVNEVPQGTAKWQESLPKTMPEVVHSLWRAPDGTLGLVVANWSERDHRVVFEVDLSQAGLDATTAAVTDLPTDDRGPRSRTTPPRRLEGPGVQIDVDVPARSAKVFEIAGQ